MSSVQLTPEQTDLFKRAKEASDRSNHDYAITLLRQIVDAVPQHLQARHLLRANELMKFKSVSAFNKKMLGVKITPMAMKAKGAIKKSPMDAMKLAEDILFVDPTSDQGNNILAEAAMEAKMLEVAVLAYETLRDAKPTDIENLKNLGRMYLQHGEPLKAQSTFDAALKIKPNDGEALKGMKDASAVHASQAGSWEDGSDFRKSLKNEAESIQLEQASKVVKSESAIDEQLAGYYAQYNEDQNNINIVLKIADLLERKSDLEGAQTYYSWANQLTNGADPEIGKKLQMLSLRTIEERLKSKQNELAAAATEEEKAALQAEYEAMLQEKAGFALQSARERSARYPNDLQLRYELGKALVMAGEYKEAVPELQQALRQPNVRHQAYNLLGQSFWKRGMLDFAVKQFQSAKSEMAIMDDLKKEITYNLGCVLEQEGKETEALDQFKEIYEMDSQYADVADRVEASYNR